MLKNKSVIVTGAAQGIGAALAHGIAALGARVTLADIKDPAEAASQIIADSGEAIAFRADVTSSSDCAGVVAAAEKTFGRVDGIVCNAALFAELPLQQFDQIEEDLWDQVMAVNVKGPWLCARAAVPAMNRTGGGSIVMISSGRAFSRLSKPSALRCVERGRG